MKYIDEYRDSGLAKEIVEKIYSEVKNYNSEIKIMEVCGTHTMAIGKFGIRRILPENIKLLSGPGCPVCVTPQSYIDKAIAFSQIENVKIATFGDMFKVPGSYSSLEKEKSTGKDVEIVYSPMDALNIAKENKDKKVIFLAIGFETTSPAVAMTLKNAYQENVKNFFIFSGHKLIPPAMEALLKGRVEINGFICPGHVSTIIGSEPYEFIPENYGIPCVITGFELLDILYAIYLIVRNICRKEKPGVEIEYRRSVKREGNLKAKMVMEEVFEVYDSKWRGLGIIPLSGLKLREKFWEYDAERVFDVKVNETKENENCICGEILKGLKTPKDCKLYRKVCNPENPVGPCMVSSEGACAAYYKYEE